MQKFSLQVDYQTHIIKYKVDILIKLWSDLL